MCLASAVIAFLSLTQHVAGLSPFNVMTNILVTEFRKLNEDIWVWEQFVYDLLLTFENTENVKTLNLKATMTFTKGLL